MTYPVGHMTYIGEPPVDPPPDDEGIECPWCHGKGCVGCEGSGRLFGDAAAYHLEDLEERAAERRMDR